MYVSMYAAVLYIDIYGKRNYVYIYIDVYAKRNYILYLYIYAAQAIFLNPVSVGSSCGRKFVVCPFVWRAWKMQFKQNSERFTDSN
jgi:hypothetical protein